MNDGDGLLRSVLEQPADDTVRLAYADWLDERGQKGDAERAEFIRVQVESNRRPHWGLCGPGETHAPSCAASDARRHACNAHGAETDRVRNRVKSLMKSQWAIFGLEVPGPWTPHGFGEGASVIYLSAPDNSSTAATWWGRGFASQISLPYAAFLEHAEAIFRSHPVERIVLTDAVVHASGGNDTYYVGGLGRFPTWYWHRLENHRSARAALETLSEVCVSHGRQLAGLPPLPASSSAAHFS